METLVLDLQSKKLIADYIANCHLVKYETGILNEINSAIDNGELTELAWFNNFGTSIRQITMNVNAYRKGLGFGFNDIIIDNNGWLKRPEFLDTEVVRLGDTSRYGNYSEVRLGRGINHIWTYALSYSFGCEGGGSAISVYGKKFKCREDALSIALSELKVMMTSKIGSKDTTNHKQPIILATLKDIEKFQLGMVQLILF